MVRVNFPDRKATADKDNRSPEKSDLHNASPGPDPSTVPTSSSPDVAKASGPLEWLVELAPLFQACLPLDCTVSVTDREKYVGYLQGKELDLKVRPGLPVPPGGTIDEALKTGRPSRKTIPESVLGIPFKSTAVPVKNEKDEVIGGLGIGVSLKNQETLTGMANNMAAALQETTATLEELAATAEKLAASQKTLLTLGENVQEKIKKTDAILHFVREVAETSNLLGLNAAIEAARAGEHGRGFSVVAGEIRKLAANSTRSVKETQHVLKEIQDHVQEMYPLIVRIANIAQDQAAGTQEAAAGMQELAATGQTLQEIAATV